jgi:hypothetical protein
MTTISENRVLQGQIAIEQILGGINMNMPLNPLAITTAGESHCKAVPSALACTLLSLCGASGNTND